MSLRDYVKTRDKFELGDGQHFGGFDFPCCDCKHVRQSADLEPCRTCDHNVNAVKDTAEHEPRAVAMRAPCSCSQIGGQNGHD